MLITAEPIATSNFRALDCQPVFYFIFFLFPKSACTSLLWEKYSFDLVSKRGFFFCKIIDFHLENTSLAQHVGFKYICRNTEILTAVDYAFHPLERLSPLLSFLSQ